MKSRRPLTRKVVRQDSKLRALLVTGAVAVQFSCISTNIVGVTSGGKSVVLRSNRIAIGNTRSQHSPSQAMKPYICN